MEFREFNKSVHRYELDHSKPRRKLTCPQCGKDKCFTPYVDVTTGQIVGEQFGVCDHKNKCGYFKYPTGSELGNNDLFTDSNKVLRRYRPPVDPDIANCIPVSKMFETLNPSRHLIFRIIYPIYSDHIIPIERSAYIRSG